jgi:hypothetical protein
MYDEVGSHMEYYVLLRRKQAVRSFIKEDLWGAKYNTA